MRAGYSALRRRHPAAKPTPVKGIVGEQTLRHGPPPAGTPPDAYGTACPVAVIPRPLRAGQEQRPKAAPRSGGTLQVHDPVRLFVSGVHKTPYSSMLLLVDVNEVETSEDQGDGYDRTIAAQGRHKEDQSNLVPSRLSTRAHGEGAEIRE